MLPMLSSHDLPHPDEAVATTVRVAQTSFRLITVGSCWWALSASRTAAEMAHPHPSLYPGPRPQEMPTDTWQLALSAESWIPSGSVVLHKLGTLSKPHVYVSSCRSFTDANLSLLVHLYQQPYHLLLQFWLPNCTPLSWWPFDFSVIAIAPYQPAVSVVPMYGMTYFFRVSESEVLGSWPWPILDDIWPMFCPQNTSTVLYSPEPPASLTRSSHSWCIRICAHKHVGTLRAWSWDSTFCLGCPSMSVYKH